MLPSSPSAAAPEPRRLPNGPSFAGDACPTAGLWSCSRASVLLSTSIAWWTENREVRLVGWGVWASRHNGRGMGVRVKRGMGVGRSDTWA